MQLLQRKPAGPLIRFDNELKELNEKIRLEEGWRALKRILTWPLKEKEVDKILARLEGIRSLFSLALASDHV